MRELVGTSNRVLVVDLTAGSHEMYEVTAEERRRYLGGKGLGLKLLYDRLPRGVDPLSEDNALVVMCGVLMGTKAPCSGRFHAVTKSPLTGIMTSASCGGPFGMQLKTAGWDGLYITGKAAVPTILRVDEEGAELVPADDVWGLDTQATQARVAPKGTSALVIGPAGEHLVRFSCIASGERYLGRGGMGAVMGSKQLKAVVAKGKAFRIVPTDQELFDEVRAKATAFINQNEMTSTVYRSFGTPANVTYTNPGKILPVNNFTRGSHDDALRLSGQAMKEAHGTKHHTCKPCSILCGKQGTFGDQKLPVPEYETVGLMGSNLGVFDPEPIARWNDRCGKLGMDTISAGGTLAWVMEASEKGLVETDLRFGSPDGVTEALEDIAFGRGFGVDMGLGSRALSEKYGGGEFAIQVKGLEIAAYDPRGSFGQGLSYAVANRGGCHLSSFMVAQEVFFGLLDPRASKGKAAYTVFFEDLNSAINSLITCQFTSFAYLLEPALVRMTPEPILSFLMRKLPKVAIATIDVGLFTKLWASVTGEKLSNRDFLMAGKRITVLERYMNTLEGITKADDTLPKRLLDEPRQDDDDPKPIPLDAMRADYYARRGYDADGIPTPATLERLGIIPR